jgi:hypothetical protein
MPVRFNEVCFRGKNLSWVEVPKRLFLETMRKENIRKLNHQICRVSSILSVASLLDLKKPSNIFSADTIDELQVELQSDFVIYNEQEGYFTSLYERKKPRYSADRTIHISLQTNDFGGSLEICDFDLILNLAILKKKYTCRLVPKDIQLNI